MAEATLFTGLENWDSFATQAAGLNIGRTFDPLFPLPASTLNGSDAPNGDTLILTTENSLAVNAGNGPDDLIVQRTGKLYAIEGGAGLDIVYLRDAGTPTFTVKPGGYVGLKLNATVIYTHGVERFQLGANPSSEMAFDLDGNAGQGYRLYQAAFARTPDRAGLSHNVHLMDEGMTLKQMAGAFMGSYEFLNRYGLGQTDAAFITALYQNVLGRGPDAVGLAGWQARLADHSWDRADVLMGFSESAENKALVGGAIQSGIMLDLL